MIKFSRTAANQYLSAADSTGLTFPNGDWSLGVVVTFDGLTTGDNPQYIFSNANFQAAGSLNFAYNTTGAASNQGRMLTYVGTTAAPVLVSTGSFSSGTYLFVLQRSGTTFTLRSCPILSTQPTDGTSVTAQATTTLSTALDGAGFKVGARQDLLAARFLDQSVGRIFRFDGTLTDLEVANLAFGKEITDIGKTPAFYIRMATNTDTTDRGSLANTITTNGSFTTSSEPAYGYVAGDAAPVLTGNPSIIGTPTQGTAVSYTPATLSAGSPTPTRTQQWTLDGVDISGATSATYTPISGDVGKALRVRQIETNTVSSTNATSSPVTVVAIPSTTVTATDITADRIFQRSGTSIAIPLSGTYTGTAPTGIQARLYGSDGTTVLMDWTTLSSATIGSGVWNATLTAPQGGMYRLAVRHVGGASGTLNSNLWGVGDLIGCIGSSSAEKWFDLNSGTGKTPVATVRKYNESGWQNMGTVGIGIDMANSLTASLGVPIGMLDYGIGGTTLAQWVTGGYAGFTAFTTGVTAVGGKLAAVISSVGSNDAAAGTVVSQADHLAKLQTLKANVRTATGQANLPHIYSGTNGRTSANDAQFNYVRTAEKIAGNETNSYYVQTIDLEVSGDNIHLTPAGFSVSGTRTVATVNPILAGTTLRKSPKITSFQWIGSEIRVAVQLGAGGTDLSPSSAITGFAASDASGALTISAAVKTNPTLITLTVNRAIVGPLVVTHLAGARPIVTTPAKDNGTVPLALDQEVLLVATAVPVGSGEIVETVPSKTAQFNVVRNTLTGADEMKYLRGKGQLMLLTNSTGSTIVVNLKGDTAGVVTVTGYGNASAAAGKNVTVPANTIVGIMLDSSSEYLKGSVVDVTNGLGLTAVLL